MTLDTLGPAGGLFALLTFNHFVIDWVFQTHNEAMNKSTNAWWRARHCFIYATGFLPLLWLMGLEPWEAGVAWMVLWNSHFFEDTYFPVYLWAKYIRRIPAVQEKGIEGFKEQFKTPLGVVLFITIDQIIHMTFLWVIVALAMM